MSRSSPLPLLILLFGALSLLLASPAQARARHHAVVHHTRPHAARRHARATPALPTPASLLMDADSGLILEERNADLPLHPASLTKTMTLLLTFEALERGSLRLGDSVTISNHAAHMAPSKLDLPPGASISVQNAIYAVVTHSANDIAVALAERLGGTEGRFAYLMNRRAAELGMTHTHFTNASGLPDAQNLSSARDMAKLARYIIAVHPQYYRVFSTRQFVYRGLLYENHNHLMETYPGMDGLKTGFTAQSGFNLIASARRNNHRLIGVIFGGRSTASRNNEMASLLDQGFVQINMPHADQHLMVAAPIIDEQEAVASAAEGEGDFDSPTVAAPAGTLSSATKASPSAAPNNDIWAIQIGAYPSRVMTDQAIQHARLALPPALAKADPVVVPLQTAQGVLFRGRLSGYNRDEAYAACKLLINCTPVSPLAY